MRGRQAIHHIPASTGARNAHDVCCPLIGVGAVHFRGKAVTRPSGVPPREKFRVLTRGGTKTVVAPHYSLVNTRSRFKGGWPGVGCQPELRSGAEQAVSNQKPLAYGCRKTLPFQFSGDEGRVSPQVFKRYSVRTTIIAQPLHTAFQAGSFVIQA